MDIHKPLFDALMKDINGLSVHSVHEVSGASLDLPEKERLQEVGLSEMEPVFFNVEGAKYCSNGLLNNSGGNIRGDTLTCLLNGSYEQVIFLQDKVPRAPELSDETQKEWNYLCKLSALAHELGHVEDLQSLNNINFKFTAVPTVDLVKAEAYAHSYCLNYLNKAGAKIALSTIAKPLYGLSKSTKKFEKDLYLDICNIIGKGRIKKWAKA
jgi:hypothetical protein